MKEHLLKAYKAGVPLLAISTPDPAETLIDIATAIFKPVICWDIVRGMFPYTGPYTNIAKQEKEIKEVVARAQSIIQNSNDKCEGNPVNFLTLLKEMPSEIIAVMMNAPDFLHDPVVRQAVWNLRDHNSRASKMLIMLGPSFQLHSSLINDVIVLHNPYPDDERLRNILIKLDQIAAPQRPSKRTLNEEEITRGVLAVRGLSAFQAEQHIAMSLTSEGIDIPLLHELRREVINQTPGLSVDRCNLTFDDIGGLAHIKEFSLKLFKARRRSLVVVRIEEIEKAMAGAEGDLSGVSQDALQVLLNALQDNEWEGMIAFGPPGSGKSLYSQVLAKTFECMSLSLDLGACKGSLVGESERKIRDAVNKIKGLGGKDVFFVATCNRTDSLPGELRRRFNRGIWMFDLPTKKEREAIWNIHIKRFNLDPNQKRPSDNGWSGANIRDCCSLAYHMQCSLIEASSYVVPAIKQYKNIIEKARKEAEGSYLSASYPGVYRGYQDNGVENNQRRVDLESWQNN